MGSPEVILSGRAPSGKGEVDGSSAPAWTASMMAKAHRVSILWPISAKEGFVRHHIPSGPQGCQYICIGCPHARVLALVGRCRSHCQYSDPYTVFEGQRFSP